MITAVYLLTIGRKLLPDRTTLASLIDTESTREFITHAFLSKGSPLVGKEFGETPFAKIKKLRLIEVRRNGLRVRVPLKEVRFREADELFFKGSPDGVLDIQKTEGIEVRGEQGADEFGLEGIQTESAMLMEGILGPDSSLVGKSLAEIKFRQQFGVIILAVHRSGKNLQDKFEDTKLAFGDTLLVQGSAEKMRRLFEQRDFINLSAPTTEEFRNKKAPWAIGALVVFMILGALGGFGVIEKIPTVQLALGAVLFVLLTRCLEPKEAYEAVDWRIIFLIMGMLGIGLAMIHSGLLNAIATQVEVVCGGIGSPYYYRADLFVRGCPYGVGEQSGGGGAFNAVGDSAGNPIGHRAAGFGGGGDVWSFGKFFDSHWLPDEYLCLRCRWLQVWRLFPGGLPFGSHSVDHGQSLDSDDLGDLSLFVAVLLR